MLSGLLMEGTVSYMDISIGNAERLGIVPYSKIETEVETRELTYS